MTNKEKKQLALRTDEVLAELYPTAECALEWGGEPWKLLIMARLSAQCTDKKVNDVSKKLFALYPTPEAVASAAVEDIEEIIRPCGLYRMKAKNICECMRILTEKYGGELVSDMDTLLSFPGVGRKIANLLRGDIFGIGGIVCDTHFIRITGRLGFHPESMSDPYRIEKLFDPLLPKERQTDFCHRIVWFGRDVCKASSPRCGDCPLRDECRYNKKINKLSCKTEEK